MSILSTLPPNGRSMPLSRILSKKPVLRDFWIGSQQVRKLRISAIRENSFSRKVTFPVQPLFSRKSLNIRALQFPRKCDQILFPLFTSFYLFGVLYFRALFFVPIFLEISLFSNICHAIFATI
jgi:hypothetical protein